MINPPSPQPATQESLPVSSDQSPAQSTSKNNREGVVHNVQKVIVCIRDCNVLNVEEDSKDSDTCQSNDPPSYREESSVSDNCVITKISQSQTPGHVAL